jgi:hypothetical protein
MKNAGTTLGAGIFLEHLRLAIAYQSFHHGSFRSRPRT